MDSTETEIQIVTIYLPRDTYGFLFLIIFAVGLVVSWVIAYVFVVMPMISLLGWPADPPTWVYIFSIITAFVGPAVWFQFCALWRRELRLLGTKERSKRLERIVASPSSLARLPHRHLEHAFRLAYPPSRAPARILTRISPGTVILVVPQKHHHEQPPRRDISFEPIETTDDSERAFEIAWELSFTDQASREETFRAIAEVEQGGNRSRVFREWASAFVRKFAWIVGGAFVLYLAIDALMNPIGRDSPGILIGIAIVLTTMAVPLFLERKWWIAPGALIYREAVAWRKGIRYAVVTPATSPFVIDVAGGEGLVVVNGKCRRFRCGEVGRFLVVLGWISLAPPPPGEDEVRSFLGIQ